jgi:hypothetical protein
LDGFTKKAWAFVLLLFGLAAITSELRFKGTPWGNFI